MLAGIAWPLAAVALSVAADRPADDPKKEGPSELQGAWKLESVETAGEVAEVPALPLRWTVEGNKILYGGEQIASLTADPSATPKIIDLHFPKPDRAYEGVYKVEGDVWKVCVNKKSEGVKQRPTDFSTKDNDELRLLVFKRDKAKEGDDGPGYVGVMLRAGEDKPEVIVVDVFDDSPAKKAGLKKDDVILKVGAVEATDLKTTVDAVRRQKPGGELVVRVKRGGEEKDLTVKVGLFPCTLLGIFE
jgi:uncharacterized protein (TIGR03067 family)